jgi:histidine triad (HIT) family protein
MEECVFCRIAAGDKEDEQLVYQDNRFTAFLNHKPLSRGHTLLIPNQHINSIHAIPTDLLQDLIATAQTLAGQVEEAVDADGLTLWQNNGYGQDVEHFHLHLMPRHRDTPYEKRVASVVDELQKEAASDPATLKTVADQIRSQG